MIGINDCLKKGFECLFARAKIRLCIRRSTDVKNYQDDPDPTLATHFVYGIIQAVDHLMSPEIAGILKVGDAVTYFQRDADIQLGDNIFFKDVWYEVVGLNPQRVAGAKLYIECMCQRNSYLTGLYKQNFVEGLKLK